MKNYKRINYLIIATFVFLLCSCASKPKFSGSGDLCGFVVDENNNPLEEYVISCRGHNGSWKTTITNKNGLFVFEDISLGECWFKGWKNDYVDLDKNMQIFGDKSKVICFQIISIDRALDKVEEMILYEDFAGAEHLLKKITYDKKSPASDVIHIYKDAIKLKKSNKTVRGDKK